MMNFSRVTSVPRRAGPTGAGSGDGGQSEVVGTLLMMTVVVVLAAIVGNVVFGLEIVQTGEPTVGPQASFTTTVQNGELTIEHGSGETVETDRLTVIGSETGTFDVDWAAQSVGDGWTSGESITITPQDGETVRIVWEHAKNGDSTVLVKERFAG